MTDKEFVEHLILKKMKEPDTKVESQLIEGELEEYGIDEISHPIIRQIVLELETVDSELIRLNNLSMKHLQLFKLMCLWVRIKQRGYSFEAYFQKKGYHRIAVYGMSYIGRALYDELCGSSIRIEYVIDKTKAAPGGIACYNSEKEIDESRRVDVMIITPITFFDEIKGQLDGHINCSIVSLEHVINDILECEEDDNAE